MMSIMFFKGESLQPIVHLSRNVLPAKSALFVRLFTGLLSAFSNSLAIQKLKAGKHDIELDGQVQEDVTEVLHQCRKTPILEDTIRKQDKTGVLKAFEMPFKGL